MPIAVNKSMITKRIIFDGPGACRLRAAGVLFRDAGGCWHAHVPSLRVTGYGRSRKAAYDSLEVMAGVLLQTVWKEGKLEEAIRESRWMEEAGIWYSPMIRFQELQEIMACLRTGSVMRPFCLRLEVGTSVR